MDVLRELVLPKLQDVRKQGGYWMARCPSHDDNKRSLSVTTGTDQPVLLKCFAGCEFDVIVVALGLTPDQLSEERQPGRGEWTPHGDAVAIYDYTDEHGELLYQVCRTADKQFPVRVPDASKKSGYRWNLTGVRRVLYRLPALAAAVAAGDVVYVVEGEKDVQAAEGAGVAATCSPGGAGKWRDEYDEWFKGAQVVIVADRDQPGRDHAVNVQTHLKPVAQTVLIVEAVEGKDLADHLAAGHALAELAPQSLASRALAVTYLEPAIEFVPPPTLICRSLLYRGAVHTLSGPPDCGKTTLACWWMLQTIRDGGSALFLDEEGGKAIVAEKFQALGAKRGERIAYVEFPSRSWDAADVVVLNDVLDELRPAIVTWDSSAAFLARAGLDENAAADVTRFYSHVLIPAARLHEAAVVVIDHDTKDGVTSRYARGSGAKLASVDVAYKIAPIRPFSKNESGTSMLTVTKDRRGWLHRNHEAVFTADPVTHGLTVSITGTTADARHPDLTPVEQQVLDALGGTPAPWPDLVERIFERHGRRPSRETMSKALNKLARMGLADEVGTADYRGYKPWVATRAV
jgi:AAA domain